MYADGCAGFINIWGLEAQRWARILPECRAVSLPAAAVAERRGWCGSVGISSGELFHSPRPRRSRPVSCQGTRTRHTTG